MSETQTDSLMSVHENGESNTAELIYFFPANKRQDLDISWEHFVHW